MKRFLPLLAAVAFLLVPGERVEAQLGFDFGPQLSYNAEVEEIGIGARLELSPPLMPLGGYASADYVLVDGSLWDFAVGGKLNVGLPLIPIKPYIGGGLTHQRWSNGTGLNGVQLNVGEGNDTGFHILGGVGIGGLLPIGAFVEGRYLIMDAFDNQFTVAVGILF